MAKETNPALVEVTVENVEDLIKDGATVTPEIAKEAGERIAKRRKENLTEQLIEITTEADYVHKHACLSMSKTKKDAKYKTEYLKKYTELHDKLTNGGITIDEFKKQAREEKNTCSKLIRENDKAFQEKLQTLNEQYPGSWNYRFSGLMLD